MNRRTYLLIYSILLLLLQAIVFENTLRAQSVNRYNAFNYNVNEGLLQSTMRDIEFDNNNFCWVSFPNGIQKFDGKDFVNIHVQPGLPDDRMTFFFRCNNGDLLISHSQGISRYDTKSNRFTQVYTNYSNLKRPVQFIGQDDQIVYFYRERGIIGLHLPDFKVVSTNANAFPTPYSDWDHIPKFSDNIINHRTAILLRSTLYLWDLKQGKLISRSDSIPFVGGYLLNLKNDHNVLYLDYKFNQGPSEYDFATHKTTPHLIKGKRDEYIGRCVMTRWQNKMLISFDNKVYLTDDSLGALGPELVNFQGDPLAAATAIWDIREDNIGNLYLTTISSGLIKLIRNNYPIRYYGMDTKGNSNTLSVLADKESNRVLVGTSVNGLLVFDTSQQLLKHFKTLPGIVGSASGVNAILKDPYGDYLLFPVGHNELKKLSRDLSQITTVPLNTDLPEELTGIDYFATPITKTKDYAIVQAQGKLYKADWKNYRVTEHFITRSYTMGGMKYNKTIITHANDELIFVNADDFHVQRVIPFKNTAYVRCFAQAPGNQIWMGTNNGIFRIDTSGRLISHLGKENGLPDDCVYAIVFDAAGNAWCSSNKGVFKINQRGDILQLKKEDGLQENEFNTNVVTQSGDGELFFGGVNGVSSFYPGVINGFEEKIDLFFTSIRANNKEAIPDTAAWNIDRITLPYNQNSLSFDFIAMGINNPEQYVYQYMMEGIDEQWIQNDGTQTVRYSLPPGHYTFKIYASRFFDKTVKPLKEVLIIIRPPFWKTWWFLSLLAAALIGLLVQIINHRARNKYEKKVQLLESERKIKLERERISRDLHDSLGAYANAVLYNTEMLEAEQSANKRDGLMKDLKFASKDIITSLRETVWALNRETYSAEDCFLRIRNFIQPLSRYYQHISFHITGKVPEGKILHYTKALNLVRLVQEAVSNSIKHAEASNITIHSEPQDDYWKISIRDDGAGFDYEMAKKLESGNGLSNMYRRATEGSFNFTIQSNEGQGTIITIVTL